MIGERIRAIREDQKLSQKDFSSKLNISLRTLQTYEQGKVVAVPYPVLKDIIKNFNINLDWFFFGNGSMYKTLNQQQQISPYYTEALSIAENEQEVENCLKEFTKEKIINKIFPKSKNFIGQVINIIFPKTERLILFLYKVLKYIKQDSVEIKNEQYKKFLISKIEKFDLLSMQNIGHMFTKWDKNKLISIIENLTENECKIIIEDIDKSIHLLKNNLDFLNKITY